jgi:hypothetical protein
MENETIPQKEKSNRRLHAVYLTIIFLLFGFCAFLAYQYKQLKVVFATHEIRVEQVVNERNDIQSDLMELKDEFAALQTNDAELNKELEDKRNYIDSLLQEAQKHKNDATIISKLRKETKTLRLIMQGYVRTIDSLGQLNNQLIAEKGQLSNQLDEQRNVTKTVEGERENLKKRIDKAALLSSFNVRAVGIKSSRGGKKDSETSKASKVDKIRVTFDLSDNDLTIPGSKQIYVRIIAPDAQEMSEAKDDEHQFTFSGTTSYFAARKTIDYQNQPMSVLINCNKQKDAELLPGKYLIEIYSDQVVIGQTTLVLE